MALENTFLLQHLGAMIFSFLFLAVCQVSACERFFQTITDITMVWSVLNSRRSQRSGYLNECVHLGVNNGDLFIICECFAVNCYMARSVRRCHQANNVLISSCV